MKKVEQKVIEFISHYNLINANDRLLVSFSGGPDSVFALYFLSKFRRKYKIELSALHFNHGLRGKESDGDEDFSVEFCESLNIPLIIKKIDVKDYAGKNKMSIEEAARKLRYNLLESVRKELNYDKIVTAHNQSDNTETILLNISAGIGLNGFAGIPIKRGKIIRPVLCLTKQEIVDYLDLNKIKYRIDSTNLKSEFKRNYLRNRIIPLLKAKINPSLDDAVFRSSKILEDYLPEIKKQTEKKSKGLINFENQKLSIDIKLFGIPEEGIIGDILKKTFRKNYNYEFEFNDFKKLVRLSNQQKGKSIQLGKGFRAVKETKFILIDKSLLVDNELGVEIKANSNATLLGSKISIEKISRSELSINKDKNVEFINADKLGGMFILRKWNNGDRFIPLGMNNYKKVSDFLTDAKVNSSDKKQQLVLVNRNKIVWVVGLRIDDRFKINSQTKKIYKLRVK